MRDGRPATATAVAVRTATRLFEDGPVAQLVFLASGKRRGRLGDLLGDTIVSRPAPGLPRAGFSPLLVVYPAVLAAAAVAVVLAFSGHVARQEYLGAVDKVCQRNLASITPAHGIDGLVARVQADHRRLAAVNASGSARKLRAEILALDARVDRAVASAAAHLQAGASRAEVQAQVRPISAARHTAAVRYAELGLRSCTG
jgi:hypothetical protein